MMGPLNSFREFLSFQMEEEIEEDDTDIEWTDEEMSVKSRNLVKSEVLDEEESDNPALLRYRGKRQLPPTDFRHSKVVPAKREVPPIGLKLAGGSQAKPHSWPFMSILWISNFNTNETYFCGATILDNFWLITAGHCAYLGEKFEVVVGEHDLKEISGNEARYQVEKVIVHPDFINNVDLPNDIALVLLKNPIVYSEFIQPACISEKPPVFNSKIEQSCVTLGWGWTRFNKFAQFLRQGSMELIDSKKCQVRFWSNYKVLDSTFCAGNKMANACSGDSGGPLMCLDFKSGKYFLYGVISWGDTACRRGQSATVFTRVDLYKDWI